MRDQLKLIYGCGRTSPGLELPYRRCSGVQRRPWRGHSLLSQSICDPIYTRYYKSWLSQSWTNDNRRETKPCLLDFHEDVLVRWELSVEPEQLLLLLSHRLHPHKSARSPLCPRARAVSAKATCLKVDLVPGWKHRGVAAQERHWGEEVGTTNERRMNDKG
jgi:hypothetical protein